ncbi:MAG: DUF4262 domain-containing protein [Actinomycetota bacterium]
MCLRCDGFEWDEIDRRTDLLIRVHGYMLVHVEAAAPWTYTVGARESWDRPELVMVDMAAEMQKTLVGAVADDYVMFGEIRDDTLDLLDVELAVVDASHLSAGLVATWEQHYAMSASTGDVVQIIPGPSWRCSRVRRLDSGR